MAQRYPHRLVFRRRAAALLSVGLLPLAAACGPDEPAPVTGTTTTTVTPTSPASPVPTTLGAMPSADPYAGQPLVDHVTWTETIDGPRLLVFPTQAGRQTTFPGSDERAWQEVLARSADAGVPGMRDQFLCHWAWARLVQPAKPSWNLEPWRPAVGYPATVEARCNPGGPER
ncbi:DUF2599 domain-containing protein [Nocardia sp. NBC_00508]|uniref:DUF2599 domain-containing protein n=1 Tax=Nocardia sp. NBC_00508 TaxID=2975992 RepID=UPI002E8225A9|nr:DUF2599 domain-containing protein [Nocardia sp. NBC_00508]WUD66866.1 DUF2599 domain-containing protein [Nocardia sp. NBC_00508]